VLLFLVVLFILGTMTLSYLVFSRTGVSAKLINTVLTSCGFGGVSFYYAPLMILYYKLGRYHFKLYENDPARSEIVIIYNYSESLYIWYVSQRRVQQVLATANLPIIAHIVL